VERTAIQEFLAYVERRCKQMGVAGIAAVAAGLAGFVAVGGGAAAVWLAVLVVVGGLLIWGWHRGMSLLGEARSLPDAPKRLDLVTWPYRGVRSPINNQVLVSLDTPGSAERAPLADFKADWHSQGRLDIPSQPAQVFGTISRGQTVLALADDGSCFLGRVRTTRAS
jgi:hypothetical protein